MKKFLIILIVVFSLVFAIYYMYDNIFKIEDRKYDEKSQSEKKSMENNFSDDILFADYYDDALTLMKSMTLEEKIGQLFLVRYNKLSAKLEINDYYPSGYVLFAKDFENQTKESIRKEIDYLQDISKTPLVIAVDEEGGYVTRVSRFNNFREEKFLSPRTYYDLGGYELLEQIEMEKAKLLLDLGVNLNLAPVADISINSSDFIYSRSFQMDANNTGEFIYKMVNYANNANISSCLKHFPGYGNNDDTHTGIVVDNRSYENFVNNDFLPFKRGIDALVPTILVSHNIINCLDSNYPASLSEKVISELRDNLKFSGVIITDDLAMDAVESYVIDGRAATMAINAGNDLIITSDFVKMYSEVLDAVSNGEISIDRVNESVLRILAWKLAYNMKG